MKDLLAVLLSVFVAMPGLGDTKKQEQTPRMVHFLHAPHPVYPKNRHLFGSGLYRIYFNPRTGWATSVEIRKSTRSSTLDQAAVDGFMKWQCEPGTLTQVTIPLAFSSN